MFDLEHYGQDWKESIEKCVEYVNAARKKGEDRTVKTLDSIMERIIYFSERLSMQQFIFDESKLNGVIFYTQTEKHIKN